MATHARLDAHRRRLPQITTAAVGPLRLRAAVMRVVEVSNVVGVTIRGHRLNRRGRRKCAAGHNRRAGHNHRREACVAPKERVADAMDERRALESGLPTHPSASTAAVRGALYSDPPAVSLTDGAAGFAASLQRHLLRLLAGAPPLGRCVLVLIAHNQCAHHLSRRPAMARDTHERV